jgi:hypothetical protein
MGIVGGAPAAPIGGPPPGIVVGGPPPGIVGGPPAGGLAIAVAPAIGGAAAPTPMRAICAVGGANPLGAAADPAGCA